MVPCWPALRTKPEIHFLSLEEVLTIYQDQVGDPAGLDRRRLGHLRACLAMPATKMGGRYTHRDLFEMAAAYLFHIVLNKPFARGNRRVGLLTALYFLYLHHYALQAEPDQLAQLIKDVEKARATKRQLADFFRSHAVSS